MNNFEKEINRLKTNELNQLNQKENRFDELRVNALKSNANTLGNHKLKFASGFFSIFAVALMASYNFKPETNSIDDIVAFDSDSLVSDISSFTIEDDFLDKDLLALELELLNLKENI